jgi:uncharacterized protein YndB with AHSA1/START domain
VNVWVAEFKGTAEVGPAAVWKILSDVDGFGSWNEGIETISVDGPLTVGAIFRMKPPGEDEMTSSIAELEVNHLLTDVTEMGELTIRVVHRLEPLSGGGTTISYQVEVSVPAADANGEQVGTAVSADFPQVIVALAAAAAAGDQR